MGQGDKNLVPDHIIASIKAVSLKNGGTRFLSPCPSKWGMMMKEIILFFAEIINSMHDTIWAMSNRAGFDFSDKDLHLWIFGLIGILIFWCVHLLFKYLSKYSITAISFVYTFTVMVVLVFAIEIQQQVTGRGNMEFDDATSGLWGFLLFFAIFLLLKVINKFISNLFGRKKGKNRRRGNGKTRGL